MDYINTVNDIKDVNCPKCNTQLSEEIQGEIDYIDLEEHIINCKGCNEEFTIIINRPIVIDILK